jgi:peptidyl-prolyl cis-trans isomerase A (cyclophilin A)
MRVRSKRRCAINGNCGRRNCVADAADSNDLVRVLIESERGTIAVEVAAGRAPVTAANFLRYVDSGYYDGGEFHRTVTMNNQPNDAIRIEVIQAGVNPARVAERFDPIPLERTTRTGLTHHDGAISMARRTPDSAVSDFFICIGDQPSLNEGGMRNPDGQGFAAFGRVVGGMEIVRAIQSAPADGQKLTPPLRILSARRDA